MKAMLLIIISLLISWNLFAQPLSGTYTIRGSSPVKLIVYDITGRKVSTLVDEWQSAGSHSVNFNASALAGGMYFYRLQAGEIVQTRKMLLLK